MRGLEGRAIARGFIASAEEHRRESIVSDCVLFTTWAAGGGTSARRASKSSGLKEGRGGSSLPGM